MKFTKEKIDKGAVIIYIVALLATISLGEVVYEHFGILGLAYFLVVMSLIALDHIRKK